MTKCVYILGSPRSGSSCLSGCIYLCGISLGKSLSSVKDKHNEKGYFENATILEFHGLLFDTLSVNWEERNLTEAEINRTLLYQGQLEYILDTEFTTDLWAIKDFRLGIFAALHLTTISHRDVSPKVILLKRDKKAVANSMAKMFNWSNITKAELLYDRCYGLFTQYTSRFPYCEVEFENLIANPVNTMATICDFIGIRYGQDKKDTIANFVEKGLVHESNA